MVCGNGKHKNGIINQFIVFWQKHADYWKIILSRNERRRDDWIWNILMRGMVFNSQIHLHLSLVFQDRPPLGGWHVPPTHCEAENAPGPAMVIFLCHICSIILVSLYIFGQKFRGGCLSSQSRKMYSITYWLWIQPALIKLPHFKFKHSFRDKGAVL